MDNLDMFAQSLSPGDHIGPYTILGQVPGGRGGMATVYKAKLHGRGEPVALKVAHAGMGSFLKDETAFLKALKLEHPHIIRIIPTPIDGGLDEHVVKDPKSGSWYFAMEFMAGGSLEDWMRRRKRLSLRDAVDIVRQIGDALDVAHQAGIVHLDVKPSNILLRNNPNKGNRHAVLTDFGIARPRGRAGRGQSALTVEYASPEQVRLSQGEPVEVGPSSDLYSLAVILYEMISGQLPHGDEQNDLLMMSKIIQEPVPLPVPHGPPELTPTMRRALAKDPAVRHAFCQELTAELEALEALSVSRATGCRRVHPAVGLLIGMVLGLGGGLVLRRGLPPQIIVVTATPTPGVEMASRTLTAISVPTDIVPTQPLTVARATVSPSLMPTVVPVLTSTPASTFTPAPTREPISTLDQTLTPTSARKPTSTSDHVLAPTSTRKPTSTPAPVPIETPIPHLLPAPTLLEPADSAQFTGWNAEVIFRWEGADPLGKDEYYVLIIRHKQGADLTWTKNAWYDASHDSVDVRGSKSWLSDTGKGPKLEWEVVIARRQIEKPDENPAGFEISKYGETRILHWSQ